ncbi:hypothetical protein H0266_02585 [Halobacillus locisalis]|uniref:Uncharacterized protein n=1 Tax=Halobacillus locisalis TaxID=220753 RepID=A0A838CNZ3_9BACI|nr:hypothetical protein [Halobacillus locisalis]MBA2173777.1 hypothetical protein [Halobacillus locisalis]
MKYINLKGRFSNNRWLVFGLLIVFVVLLFPFVKERLEERPRKLELEHSNFYTDGFSPLYQSIQKEFDIDGATMISDFRIVVDHKGEFQYINLVLTTQGAPDTIMYAVEYDQGNDHLLVRRELLENHRWFAREFDVPPKYFFQLIDDIPSSEWGSELDYYRITSSAERRGFDIEERATYKVSGEGKVKVSYSQLPVQGIWLRVCGTNQQTMESGMFHGCDLKEHWIMDSSSDRR